MVSPEVNSHSPRTASTWACLIILLSKIDNKRNAQHTFIELLAYYRNHILAPNPGNIKAIKQTVSTYDGQVSFEVLL